ncbi:MAG TPA: MgtC/SapB family protein [Opitutaceae bacterium]|nr:MgtC/SapB family protein [Opitutaceae bacterium]
MPLQVEWFDVAWRLVLTFVVSALIGLDREVRARPAGLRTTVLVGLAAAVSMVEANFLLAAHVLPSGSDVLRFPTGILSGMGFIGGGTILRRGNLVQGVTTAATLWFVTVIGLCIGAGYDRLGLISVALALFVLWVLRGVENRLPQNQLAMLELAVEANGPPDDTIKAELTAAGLTVRAAAVTFLPQSGQRELRWKVSWRDRSNGLGLPSRLVQQLAVYPQITKLHWKPRGVDAEI